MKGLKQIFTFTLKQQLNIKSVKILTVVMALLLFFGPFLGVVISSTRGSGSQAGTDAGTDIVPGQDDAPAVPSEDLYSADGIKAVFCVLPESLRSADNFEETGFPEMTQAVFYQKKSLEEAFKAAAETPDALVLSVTDRQDDIMVQALRPEGSALPEEKAMFLSDTASTYLPYLLTRDAKALEAAMKAVTVRTDLPDAPEESMSEEQAAAEEMRHIFSMILPYVNVMLIYFLVLYYGQSSATSVILEKTSKLMDTFLTSVKPESMVLGKVLACWAAALIQFVIWVIALVLGFAAGRVAVGLIPGAKLPGLYRIFDLLKSASGAFTLPNILLAVILVAAGFFMYCCLAGICGSFASKQEELASTIGIFTILLVVSMFVGIRVGFMQGEMSTGAAWYDFVPFTAIMITPARLLLGKISLVSGLASILVTVLLSLVFVRIAGRAYKAMSLYKGNVPKLKDIPALLKN
ncbi:MAG: ABC transporter permease [Lachnospiraceae bacterium]|nr:ABC transporter permease [Lachnospiraceae bacterium]